MKKTVLTFGLISGALMALMMFGTMLFIKRIGFDKGEIVGYTGICAGFPAHILRCSLLSRKHWRRDNHFRPRLRGRHSDRPHLVRLLRNRVGDSLFQFISRL